MDGVSVSGPLKAERRSCTVFMTPGSRRLGAIDFKSEPSMHTILIDDCTSAADCCNGLLRMVGLSADELSRMDLICEMYRNVETSRVRSSTPLDGHRP